MKYKILLPLLFLLIGALPAVSLAQDNTTPSETKPVISTRQYQNLMSSIQASGSARVLVELDLSIQPEGDLPDMQAVQSQRAAMVQAQESLIQRLSSYDIGEPYPFKYIPFVAMSVDQDGFQALMSDAGVASITENRLRRPLLGESIPLVGGDLAAELGFTGEGWAVAVLDTGVERTHSFLAGRVVEEACYSSGSLDPRLLSVCPDGADEQTGEGSAAPCSMEGCDHGTHVAGIAAGKGETFHGVAPDASIIAVQIGVGVDDLLTCRRSNWMTTPCLSLLDVDILKGVERVYELRDSYHIAAINLSLGGELYTSAESCELDNPAYKGAIDLLSSVGIATVVASGNAGATNAISAPACISNAVSVGSVGDGSWGSVADNVSIFSNSASFLDLLAPGNSIRSSVPGDRFADFGGTSMSTPHVAGAWAMLKSCSPNATIDEILQVLKDTGVSITDTRNDIVTSRIQIDAAIKALGCALEAPSDLTVLSSSATSVELQWSDNSDDEDGFRVLRSQDGSEWSQIAQVEGNTTRYTDGSVLCETTYAYQVVAYKQDTTSQPGNTVEAMTGECVAPGDCNKDEVVNAADLSAISLERSQGTFGVAGCDANLDGIVTSDDMACGVRRIFGRECPPMTQAAPLATSHPASLPRNRPAASLSGIPGAAQTFFLAAYAPPRSSVSVASAATTLAASDPTSVTIQGATWGAPFTDYTFTATVLFDDDDDTTTPLTYTWEPAPDDGQNTTRATYQWETAGMKVIDVTVTNGTTTVSDTHTITLTNDTTYAIAPEAATINGPAQGFYGEVYTFTATVSPTSITRPVSYTWKPEPLTGQGTLTATYRWDSPGPKTVEMTAANIAGAVSATHSITIETILLEEIALDGPVTGTVNVPYTFTAQIEPPDASEPVSYIWQPEPLRGQHTLTATYQWSTPGTRTVTLTAENVYSDVFARHTITVLPDEPGLGRVTVQGASSGKVHTDYYFTAQVEPSEMLTSTTYAWTPEPLEGQGTPLALYRWPTRGMKTIVVTATSGMSQVRTSHDMFVEDLPDGPALTMPNWKPGTANHIVQMPIRFLADGYSIASLAFSVNYDEDHLLFDPTIPDAVTSGGLHADGQEGFFLFDIMDRGGELDIALTDSSDPLSTLLDDTLVLTLTFRTRHVITDTLTTVAFSTEPLASFGPTDGFAPDTDGSTVNGSLHIAGATGPVVGLPPSVVATAYEAVEVPVWYRSNHAEAGRTRFRLNYDEASMRFDSRDENSDGVPDAITFSTNVTGSVTFDPDHPQGEILIEVGGIDAFQGSTGSLAPSTPALLDATEIVGIRLTPTRTNGLDDDTPIKALWFSEDELPAFEGVDGGQMVGSVDGGAGAGTMIIVETPSLFLPAIKTN